MTSNVSNSTILIAGFECGQNALNNVSNEVASNKIIAVIMNRNESTIFENEFEDTTWLKLDKLVLPENLQHIGRRAFHNSNIKGTLELPDYVVVSDDAFDSDFDSLVLFANIFVDKNAGYYQNVMTNKGEYNLKVVEV